MLDCYQDDYGVNFDPRYFPVTPEEYRKLTSDGTDVDLSGYYTSGQTDALLDKKADKSELSLKQDKISDLNEIRNGAALGSTAIQEEVDPTVPSWAKQPNKPSYTASEVGALPSSTIIPSKTSDLTNDSGFITGYTETDPTVPAWAKETSKPTYTAQEVGAQEIIEDLDIIRSGATLGLTSIQKIMIETTHEELKNLRNTSELSPGQLYRVTDYVTTTTQEGTRSAGHAFDIIVTALSNSELSEEAKAIAHSDDTYFANCELSAWELKYCLDNDASRFAWADETNGKGVIYYMKDEWNNECPYDFKNIQFKRYAITNVSTTGYTQDETSALSETFLFGNNGNKCFATKDVYGNWVPANESHQSGSDSQNTSIEWEIDENTFAWYYTFNGEKKESADGEIELYDITSQKLILSPECIQWLESEGSGSDISDNCYNNSIKPRTWEYFGDDEYYKGRIVLNDIVFLNGVSYCYYNNEDESWEYSTAYCYGNVFGVECRNNTIGNSFGSNTIGNYFRYNTIGNAVYNNSIGNSFGSNTIGNNFQNNSIGNEFYYNTIGNYFQYNTIGNDFQYNTIGNDFGSNTIGNNVYRNTIGNYFRYNTIGNNFQNNSIGNSFGSNTIGNNFQNNSIGNYVYNNSIGNYFNQNTIGNDFQNNRLGEDVQYLDFTTNYGSVTLQYLYVLSGYKYDTKTSVPTGITANATYSQTIGFNTAGAFVVKNMLD